MCLNLSLDHNARTTTCNKYTSKGSRPLFGCQGHWILKNSLFILGQPMSLSVIFLAITSKSEHDGAKSFKLELIVLKKEMVQTTNWIFVSFNLELRTILIDTKQPSNDVDQFQVLKVWLVRSKQAELLNLRRYNTKIQSHWISHKRKEIFQVC